MSFAELLMNVEQLSSSKSRNFSHSLHVNLYMIIITVVTKAHRSPGAGTYIADMTNEISLSAGMANNIYAIYVVVCT